jgi:hypothetical protein
MTSSNAIALQLQHDQHACHGTQGHLFRPLHLQHYCHSSVFHTLSVDEILSLEVCIHTAKRNEMLSIQQPPTDITDAEPEKHTACHQAAECCQKSGSAQ